MLKKVYLTKAGKVVKFRNKVKQIPAYIDSDTGKISNKGIYKLRKKDWKFNGIQFRDFHGHFMKKPDKGQTQIIYNTGYVYKDGMKILNLEKNSAISVRHKNWLVANLKGGTTPEGKIEHKKVETRLEFLELLLKMYPGSGQVITSIEQEQEKHESFSHLKDVQPFTGELPFVLKADRILYKKKPTNNYIDKFITLDTEDDSNGNIKMVDIFDGSNHHTIENDDSIKLKMDTWEYLDKTYSRSGAKIFCVNLQYDLNNLFSDIWKTWNPVFSGNMLLTTTLEQDEKDKNNKRKNIKFYEVMAQLRLSVEDIGKLLNLQKLKVIDRVNVDYVKRDTEIPWFALKEVFEFDKKNNIEFAISLGGKTLKKFKTDYLLNSLKQRIYTEFIPCYRGGRNEIFKMQGENVNVYDINSLYPYVMSEYEFPNPGIAVKSKSFKELGIYYVEVEINKNTFLPVLGVIRGGKYIFPTGHFRGMFTGAEIIKAHKEKQIKNIKIIDGYEFISIGKIFNPIIQDLYKLRLENYDNKLINNYVKYLMNSLYGKFAQKNKNIEYMEENDVFKNTVTKYPDHSNFIWSIFITSYARLELYKKMDKNKEKVLYCDTDSIHLCDNNTLDISTDLGALKHEGFFEYANYLQPKCYQLIGKDTTKYKVKGIPKKHRAEFFNYGKVKFKRPVKIFEFLRNQYQRDLNPELKRKLVLNDWITVKKVLRSAYDKRNITNDKGDTKPINLI